MVDHGLHFGEQVIPSVPRTCALPYPKCLNPNGWEEVSNQLFKKEHSSKPLPNLLGVWEITAVPPFSSEVMQVLKLAGSVKELSILNQQQQAEIPACNWPQDFEFDLVL